VADPGLRKKLHHEGTKNMKVTKDCKTETLARAVL
jgi:hypothetical protein